MVVNGDSLTPIPYVAIVVRHSQRGVYSNMNGYYTIATQENDTLDFFALGYHRATFIMPDTFVTNQFTHIQALKVDTVFLHEALIYPWPTPDQFKNAFLAANVPEDDWERARQNLSESAMRQVAKNVAMDAGMVYSSSMQQHVDKNYYAGQKPPNNLLNPIAWSRFIQSVQRGDLKNH